MANTINLNQLSNIKTVCDGIALAYSLSLNKMVSLGTITLLKMPLDIWLYNETCQHTFARA